jgi:hypothetical protein
MSSTGSTGPKSQAGPGGQQGRGSGNKRREGIGNGLDQWAEKGFWARIGK